MFLLGLIICLTRSDLKEEKFILAHNVKAYYHGREAWQKVQPETEAEGVRKLVVTHWLSRGRKKETPGPGLQPIGSYLFLGQVFSGTLLTNLPH